jgi:hypothetical protein
MERKSFDLTQLPDGVGWVYERLLRLGPAAAEALKGAYGVAVPAPLEARCEDERAFNAYAWSNSGADHVGFTAALPCLLHFCFNRLLATRELLPRLGNAERETNRWTATQIPLVVRTEATLAEAVAMIPAMSRPVDYMRALAATSLAELAGMFAVLHEVGHVACGHTRYSELHLAGEPVSEFFGLADVYRRRRYLRQVWELEADMVAAMLLTRWIFGPEPNQQFFSDAFAGEEGWRHDEQAIAVTLVALYAMFLYMNQGESGDGWFRSHPPPLVRISYIHNVMRLFARVDFGIEAGGLDDHVDGHVLQVNAAWRALGLPLPRYRGDPLDQMSLLMRQRDRLARHYEEFAWIPPASWRRTVDDFYSYLFLREE